MNVKPLTEKQKEFFCTVRIVHSKGEAGLISELMAQQCWANENVDTCDVVALEFELPPRFGKTLTEAMSGLYVDIDLPPVEDRSQAVKDWAHEALNGKAPWYKRLWHWFTCACGKADHGSSRYIP